MLVAEPTSFRFRHALLAEAVYATILPGEREELHARLADELADAAPAGRARAALGGRRSPRRGAGRVGRGGARAAEAVFGLPGGAARTSSARSRCGLPCRTRGLDLDELCAWAAELAGQTGAAPRAVELARRAIELVGERDPLLHERLGRYLHGSGRADLALAASERAVELVPARRHRPSARTALAALATGLMLAWRYEESLPLCEQALAIARVARRAELRALTVLGTDLAYLGRADEGLAQLRRGAAARRPATRRRCSARTSP